MNLEETILEQYKLYVNTAVKVSYWRQTSNKFFLTLNSVLLAFTGFLTTLNFAIWHIVLALAGIFISILWFLTITSFRNLNSAKFKVIHNMEKALPFRTFGDEWDYLKNKYIKISLVEQGIPIIFLFLYMVIIVLILF